MHWMMCNNLFWFSIWVKTSERQKEEEGEVSALRIPLQDCCRTQGVGLEKVMMTESDGVKKLHLDGKRWKSGV